MQVQEFDSISDVPQPDPFLSRMQNRLGNELGKAQSEIKALRASDALKEKNIQRLKTRNDEIEENLRITEKVLKQKNVEMKKLAEEKKDVLAAQFAAETALRKLHENQTEDEHIFSLESIITPLEAEIKMHKTQITTLREDNKALERLTKSKEMALLETEKILRSALERALIVEEIHNQNLELKRQLEICQEENRILEKANRQKVLEVEKLTETVNQLEEAVLAGGAVANVIRDYQRHISELKEEKRTVERELARAKVSENRAASALVNRWKDENEKVMSVKQWLEQRRLLQAEMQRVKEKLALAERTAKAEEQLKDKFQLRLKTLEDCLQRENNVNGENIVRKSSVTSKSIDHQGHQDNKNSESIENTRCEDMVSGFLYDKLQKEVISLRKSCQAKEDHLRTKEEDKILLKKIEARKGKKKISATHKPNV